MISLPIWALLNGLVLNKPGTLDLGLGYFALSLRYSVTLQIKL